MNDKEVYKELLENNIVLVKFIKVNGDERLMKCTLREDKLPIKSKSTSSRVPNDDVISVYDLEKEDWRSFRVDSVISTIIVDG